MLDIKEPFPKSLCLWWSLHDLPLSMHERLLLKAHLDGIINQVWNFPSANEKVGNNQRISVAQSSSNLLARYFRHTRVYFALVLGLHFLIYHLNDCLFHHGLSNYNRCGEKKKKIYFTDEENDKKKSKICASIMRRIEHRTAMSPGTRERERFQATNDLLHLHAPLFFLYLFVCPQKIWCLNVGWRPSSWWIGHWAVLKYF